MSTLYGHRVLWCKDTEAHPEHNRFDHATQETTICEGTTTDEALAWEYERAWARSDNNE